LRSFDLSDPEREDVSKSNWTSVDLHGSPVGASSFPVCARFQFVGASRGHAKQARPSTEAESPRCINARIRAPTGWDGHRRDCFRVIARSPTLTSLAMTVLVAGFANPRAVPLVLGSRPSRDARASA